MATRLFLVRHGATTLSAEDRFAGSTDVPLSEEGRRQAAALSERLRPDPIAAVPLPTRRKVSTLEGARRKTTARSPGEPVECASSTSS